MTIRWFAFDAVGTLIYPDPPVAAVYCAAARRHGSKLNEDDVRDRFRTAFRESEQSDFTGPSDWDRADRLRTSEEFERGRWRAIVRSVFNDIDAHDACFEELFEHFGRAEAWSCFPDVEETLTALKERGFHLAVASNFDRRLHTICDGLPELRPLDLRIISSEVGYRKPSLHFYRALIESCGGRPEEIVMVGDDFENDIAGARQAGLQAIELIRRGEARGASRIGDLRELLNWV